MNDADNYRRRGGNIILHITLNPDGTLQPMASLSFDAAWENWENGFCGRDKQEG